MRSKLFVPAARPELFEKALASDADAISFDLEDSVSIEGKAAARSRLIEFLRGDVARSSAKRLIVRINALGTPFAEEDLSALANSATHIINVPKVEDPETVAAIAAMTEFPLLLTIETPGGLRRGAEIAAAHRRVIGLQVGLNDLFEPLGIDRRDPNNVHAALWQIRLSAGDAGCFAFDGAWPDIEDEAGFRAEAALAHRLGYLGKSCIHPRQVPLANAAFQDSFTPDEARRLLAVAEKAATRGEGAFAFEGRMIDRPAIERAKAVLASARAGE